jgi:Fe/S biogenesis protein NfuA
MVLFRQEVRFDMLVVKPIAADHFRRLLGQQGIAGLGIRIRAVYGGTPKADCQLEFCESADLAGDEIEVACDGFSIFVEAASAAFLEGAELDYQTSATGGQLTIRAPKIKGAEPGPEASLAERIDYVLQTEINPQIAAHGGRVGLVSVDDAGVVLLRFGGGCHGCGMADVTLKQGIERTLRTRLPQISAVRDVTDHAGGQTPYYRGHDGASAVR